MKRWIGWAGMLLATLAQASPGLTQLQYITEEYKPYNYADEKGNPTGLAVELLQQVWQQTATPPQRITLMPWARGYYLLTQKPNVVLFATARTHARNPLFKWACAIGYADIVLMGLKKNNIKLTELAQAANYKITAVRADVGEQLLLNNGFDENRLLTANRVSQSLKLLTTGRAELIAINKLTLQEEIAAQQLAPEAFSQAWVLSSEQLCYAFSQSVGDDVIERFQHGLTQVLASSEYQQLYRKYLLHP